MWVLIFSATFIILVPPGSSSDHTTVMIKTMPVEIGTVPGDFPFHLTVKMDYIHDNYTQFCDTTLSNELALSTLSCFNASGLMANGKYEPNQWNFEMTLHALTGHNLLGDGVSLGRTSPEKGGLIFVLFKSDAAYAPSHFTSFPKLWHGREIQELENFGVLVLGKAEGNQERGVVGVLQSNEVCQQNFGRKLESHEGCVHGLAGDCKFYSSNPVLLAVSMQLVGVVTNVTGLGGCDAIMTTSIKIRQIYKKYSQ